MSTRFGSTKTPQQTVGIEARSQCAIDLGCYDGSRARERYFNVLLIETFAAFAIIRSVFVRRPNTQWLDRPAVVRLGELSYGLYVVHMPILWITAAAIAAAVGAPAVAAHGAFAAATLFAVGFPLSLGLAILGHRFIELPGIAVGRRLGARRETHAA